MSERGSFCTEYIYCQECFNALQVVLASSRDKFLCASAIPAWSDSVRPLLPIIAGKIGGLYSGEELHEFDIQLRESIESALCHPLRIAVLSDSGGDVIFHYEPRKKMA